MVPNVALLEFACIGKHRQSATVCDPEFVAHSLDPSFGQQNLRIVQIKALHPIYLLINFMPSMLGGDTWRPNGHHDDW